MQITHKDRTIELLGDPHLGRSFVNGVPLHRRGDREKMVVSDFRKSVLETEADIHICMGDLFDKWAVPYTAVCEAIETYQQADKDKHFFVLMGNHDPSKDLERKGAFDLFRLAMEGFDNVIVVTKAFTWEGLGFFPWSPTVPADELILPCDIAFGHWDTIFGHDNMIPTEKMEQEGIEEAYTGHVHKPETFTRDGVKVTVVGSMQPYAHGEDDGEMYVTFHGLDEIEGDLTNRCVRVILKAGEVFDMEIDCLQLSVQREKADDEDDLGDVTIGDFDMATLFQQAFATEGVSEAIQYQLMERYEAGRISQ